MMFLDFWETPNGWKKLEETSGEVDEGMTYAIWLMTFVGLANIMQTLVFDVRFMKQEHSGISCHPLLLNTSSSCPALEV